MLGDVKGIQIKVYAIEITLAGYSGSGLIKWEGVCVLCFTGLIKH